MAHGRYTIFALVAALLAARSYQQTPPSPPSAEVKFCMEQTPASTLRTFWTEANQNCAKDPYKLADMYESAALNGTSDKCGKLLQHQLRKSLIATSATVFEEALISGSFAAKIDINRLASRLGQLDQRILDAIWERTIEAVYFFMDGRELLEAIAQCTDVPTQITAGLRLQWKQMQQPLQPNMDITWLRGMVTFWKALKNSAPQHLQQQVDSAYRALPEQLRLLYNSEGQLLRLLNVAHCGYLYAPRDNGPDSERRTPLTWIEQNNTFDSNGYFEVTMRYGGLMTIGRNWAALDRYLYVDEEYGKPYFGIDTRGMSRFWNARWYGSYYTLRNVLSDELLCATEEYYEERRYVTLRPDNGTEDISECYWMIVKAKGSLNCIEY